MKASRYRSNGDTSVEQDSVVILHPPPPVRLMGLTSELNDFCCISFCCSGCHTYGTNTYGLRLKNHVCINMLPSLKKDRCKQAKKSRTQNAVITSCRDPRMFSHLDFFFFPFERLFNASGIRTVPQLFFPPHICKGFIWGGGI